MIQEMRRLRRRSNVSWAISVVMTAAMVGMAGGYWTTRQSLDNAQAINQSQRGQLAVSQVAVHSLSTMLTAEQLAAGGFEAERNRLWERVVSAERRIVYLQQLVNRARAQNGERRIEWRAYRAEDICK